MGLLKSRNFLQRVAGLLLSSLPVVFPDNLPPEQLFRMAQFDWEPLRDRRCSSTPLWLPRQHGPATVLSRVRVTVLEADPDPAHHPSRRVHEGPWTSERHLGADPGLCV